MLFLFEISLVNSLYVSPPFYQSNLVLVTFTHTQGIYLQKAMQQAILDFNEDSLGLTLVSSKLTSALTFEPMSMLVLRFIPLYTILLPSETVLFYRKTQ